MGIREAELSKVPYMAVVGAREAESGNLSVRKRGEGNLGEMAETEFIHRLKSEAASGIV